MAATLAAALAAVAIVTAVLLVISGRPAPTLVDRLPRQTASAPAVSAAPIGVLPAIDLPACAAPGAAETRGAYFRVVRAVESGSERLPRPDGLAYSTASNALLLVRTPGDGSSATELHAYTVLGDPVGTSEVPAAIPDAINVDFSAAAQELVYLDAGRGVFGVAPIESGVASTRVREVSLGPLAIGDAQGLSIDPQSGDALVLDAAGRRLIRLRPGDPANLTTLGAVAGSCSSELAPDVGGQLRGLAVQPSDGHLFVYSHAAGSLLELSPTGQLLTRRGLGPLHIGQLAGLAFAPSGDPTDDPATQNLYLADADPPGGGAAQAVLELAIKPPTATTPPTAEDRHATLERTIDTADWRPPSTDPAGLGYDSSTERLVVTDVDVDETPRFADANVFEASLNGALQRTAVTAFSREPADVAIDVEGRRRFYVDDSNRRLVEAGFGEDDEPNTEDDPVVAVDTTTFGSFDPEGLAFGDGEVFISDGLAAEIYRVSLGANGQLDGLPPEGDDAVVNFDTSQLGQIDPEDVAYNANDGTLLIISNDPATDILEVSPDGDLVRVVDLGFLFVVAPAGIAWTPGADGTGTLWLADRGIDNSRDPNQNDGRLYELRLRAGPAPNLLANGGFELDADADALPDGWDGSGVTLAGDVVRSGTRAARLASVEGAEAFLRQTVEGIRPQATFRVSGWVFVDARAPVAARLRLAWQDADGEPIDDVRLAEFDAPTGGWTGIASDVTAPPGAAAARLVLTLTSAETEVYVDDLVFVQTR